MKRIVSIKQTKGINFKIIDMVVTVQIAGQKTPGGALQGAQPENESLKK